MNRHCSVALFCGVILIAGCGGNRHQDHVEQGSNLPGGALSAPESIPYQVPRPVIVTREEWGSQPDTAALQGREHEPQFITIHHAGTTWKPGTNPAVALKNLQTWGRNEKSWPDVPYHYLISPDGRIYEGRDIHFVPETNTNYETTGHVGVHLWGNFEEVRASREQLVSLVDTIAWICQEYHIDPVTIAGHKDRPGADTVCPGKDLSRYIAQGNIQEWVRAKMAGEEPEIETLPSAADGPEEFIRP